MEASISDFESRLKYVEELADAVSVTLDRLITSHNNLCETVLKIGKAHDNVTAEFSQEIDDMREALDLVLSKAAPLHQHFQSEVNRVLRDRPSDNK